MFEYFAITYKDIFTIIVYSVRDLISLIICIDVGIPVWLFKNNNKR